MPTINEIVVYTASNIVTANPTGAAVNHTWSLPLGGGSIVGGSPNPHQATVTWGNSTGNFTVRDTIGAQVNGCPTVNFDLPVGVTNGGGGCTTSIATATISSNNGAPTTTGPDVQYTTTITGTTTGAITYLWSITPGTLGMHYTLSSGSLNSAISLSQISVDWLIAGNYVVNCTAADDCSTRADNDGLAIPVTAGGGGGCTEVTAATIS